MAKKKRDMQASAKTLAYFLTTRGGRPTAVSQAARALKISSKRVAHMASRFAQEGRLVRIHRGVYSKPANHLAVQAPAVDPNQQLLDSLLKEREHLDAQIEKVRAVIELQNQRKAGGK